PLFYRRFPQWGRYPHPEGRDRRDTAGQTQNLIRRTMLEETLSYLGLQFAKLQFRSDVDTIQPMTEFLTGARNALITLPTGYDNSILAGAAIRSYRERLSHLHLTIVHNSTRSTPLSEFPRSEVVRIDPHDINRFSLPR